MAPTSTQRGPRIRRRTCGPCLAVASVHCTLVSIALVARNVSHRFGATSALEQVSLDVPAGRTVALVGESGSGKTTLLRCFNRMVQPVEGTVFVGDLDVREQNAILLRRRLGYVQQTGGLLPHWTAAQNVALPFRAMGRHEPRLVDEALAFVGLTPAVHGSRYPQQLSGGQRQRVALARALAAKPEAILLDEPFGALDAISRADTQAAYERMRRELRITSLLVTHDLAEAARLADEIVVMRAGRVEQRGTIVTLRDSPETEYVRSLVQRATTAAQALLA
jgi:osmoprotectant transport system ATP-binding protein